MIGSNKDSEGDTPVDHSPLLSAVMLPKGTLPRCLAPALVNSGGTSPSRPGRYGRVKGLHASASQVVVSLIRQEGSRFVHLPVSTVPDPRSKTKAVPVL